MTASGADAEGRQRVQDPRARGDHARVGDDEGVAVTHEDDAARAALVGVAGGQQVDARHRRVLVTGAW